MLPEYTFFRCIANVMFAMYYHVQNKNKTKPWNFVVLGLCACYIHRIYSVGCLWGNVKKCSADLPFFITDMQMK